MKLGGTKGFRRAMAWSPAALLIGLALGIFAHHGHLPAAIADVLGPLGNLWTRALQLSVVPLLATMLVSGIGVLESQNGFGRWTLNSLILFTAILLMGALVTAALAAAFLPSFGPSRMPVPGGADTALPESAPLTFGAWIEGLLPSNLIQAASGGEMLPITLSAILFALAVRQVPDAGRTRIVGLFAAIRDAVLVYLGWVLLLMPFGAFALAYAFSAESGFAAAGAAMQFLAFSIGILLATTLLLYLLTVVLGRVPLLQFIRAVYPAQTVAVGSRSSLASLPSLVQGAQELDLPDPASEVVLPLAVSVFKPNRTVTSTAKLFFVAALFGVSLTPGAVAAFVLTVIALSVSTPGLPSMGTRMTFGAYVAAGLPPAGIMLFEALDPMIDVFKTLYNVTANLASAAIVSRFTGRTRPASAAALDSA